MYLSARPQTESTRETAHVELRGSLTVDRPDAAVVPLLVPRRKAAAFERAVGSRDRVEIVEAVEIIVPGSRLSAGLVLTVEDADAAEQLAAALLRAAELRRTRMSEHEAEHDERHAGGGVPRLDPEPFPVVRVPIPVDGEATPHRPATHTREEWDAAIVDAQQRAAQSFLGYAFLEPRSLYGDHAPFPIYSVALGAQLDAQAADVDAT